MLEDLLLKARAGGGFQSVGSRHSIGRSPFPSVAGSSWGDSIASKTNYSLPTVTETDVSNVVGGGEVLQEPFSSKQGDGRLAANVGGEIPGSDSLKTLQEIRRSEKQKRQSKMWKWSREGRQNPLLPAGDDKGAMFLLKRCSSWRHLLKCLRQDRMIPSRIDISFIVCCARKTSQ